MFRLKTIAGFIREYTALAALTAISTVIALVYVFTSNLPELFPFAGELFALVDALGLAIIANCIFCFFQIYLPECRERECVKTVMSISLNRILKLMRDPYERMYQQKTGVTLSFEEIPEEEMKTLLDGIDPKGSLGYHAIAPNGTVISPATYAIIYSHIENARKEIEQFISMYGKYLDANCISTLMEIHKCTYFTTITTFHNTGVLDKLTNIGPSEDLVSVQQLYKRLKEYVSE